MRKGNVTFSGDTQEKLDDLFDQLDKARIQLQSDRYSRLVAYLDLPEEGDETFEFLDEAHNIVAKYYSSDCYVVGNSTSAKDLSSTFGEDNMLTYTVGPVRDSGAAVYLYLGGAPVLLIVVIQGSIWLNFSFPYLQDSRCTFWAIWWSTPFRWVPTSTTPS